MHGALHEKLRNAAAAYDSAIPLAEADEDFAAWGKPKAARKRRGGVKCQKK